MSKKTDHIAGNATGNDPQRAKDQRGLKADGTSTAARSTGINPKNREPIDKRMPNLSPA